MFIGGLHLDTKTDGLRDFYSQWGEIVDAVVMRDPNTKRSRGYVSILVLVNITPAMPAIFDHVHVYMH